MVRAAASIAVSDRRAGAWLGRVRSVLDIRYLGLLTSVATYALIVWGGVVRVTDSGLACPDWPRCQGQLIPTFSTPVLIKYSHRLAAAGVGLLIVGTAVVTWLWHRDNRFLLAGATLTVPLLITQVLVGGVTVNLELPDTVVAVHLAIALVLLAVLIVTTAAAFWERHTKTGEGSASAGLPSWRAFPVLAAAAAAATLILILIGSYVANSGASLVYPDWPLFNGRLVTEGGRLANLHYAHRLMAVVVGLMVLAVVAHVWRKERRPVIVAVVSAALVLYIAEVLVGASNIWFSLATWARIAHLALATALWAVLVFGAAWGYAELRATGK